MAPSRHTTTMEKLPDEVLSEILTRLLAKQLAQMRCVSKPWNALLSESSFIKSHLSRSLKKNDEVLLLFGQMISFELSPTPFIARPSCSPDLDLPNFITFPVYPPHVYGCGTVIGSVNGLICFFYASSSSGDKAVHIWNPSLSALLALPSSPFPSGGQFQFQHGFGFDPKTNDYKVIRLTFIGDSPPQCEVYSMKKGGSWESISQRFPSHLTISDRRDEVYVNGHLHWLGTCYLEGTGFPLRIVAFDVGAEIFIEMPLPKSILEDCNWYNRLIELGVLGGKLCVMSCIEDGEWEVWVMEEYGVFESWVKLQSFPPFSGIIFPYGFTSHGQFLFQVDQDNDNQLMTKTFKISWRYCSISRFVEYVDSLVWVNPPNREISSSDIPQLQIRK